MEQNFSPSYSLSCSPSLSAATENRVLERSAVEKRIQGSDSIEIKLNASQRNTMSNPTANHNAVQIEERSPFSFHFVFEKIHALLSFINENLRNNSQIIQLHNEIYLLQYFRSICKLVYSFLSQFAIMASETSVPPTDDQQKDLVKISVKFIASLYCKKKKKKKRGIARARSK